MFVPTKIEEKKISQLGFIYIDFIHGDDLSFF